MSRTPIQAQPPLEFIPPALDPRLVRAVGLALPWWLKLKTPIARIATEGADRLAELYREFHAGKVRFLLAFRHPSTYDPLCMGELLLRATPRATRTPIGGPTNAYFLYDRGVPLWAGSLVGWLLPRLGGISVQRGKLDRTSLRTARELFVRGDLPLMAAPEGATNGHSEVVSPLEPGIAQMGFWCLEDLAAEGRDLPVLIVPVGIRYGYLEEPWTALEQVLAELEGDCGLPPDRSLDRTARLGRIGEKLLAEMEEFYRRFYGHDFRATAGADFNTRLAALLEAALTVAEQYFDLQARGSLIDRCRRIEQAGWERIYREDLKDATLTPVERGLADRVAEEADLRMWHMRLVESFVAVTSAYLAEKPSADRFAEVATIARRTVQRLKGEDTFAEPDLGRRWARVSVGEPLTVNAYAQSYRSGRQGAKQAVADLTRDLQSALEAMLHSD
jgi:1-acyl-sn-glycerol-3-phosphate acyltransferase